MPYIPEEDRERAAAEPSSPGELNYAITQVLLGYWDRQLKTYTTLNDISGALHNAYMEFYLRVTQPYEEHKRKVNGDVFPQ